MDKQHKIITKTLVLIYVLLLNISSLHAEERIMPLGDSITYGHTSDGDGRSGYRNYLWYMLDDLNSTYNFVGSRSVGSSVTPAFDINNEGHPGWTSYEIAERTYAYLNHSSPDTILLHIGTNDRSTSVLGVQSILNEVDTYERESGKSVRVLIALIIDRRTHDSTIEQFNENLKKLVYSRMTGGDNIELVDMYTEAGLTSSNYADNTHPNNSGYSKMAPVWYRAILKTYNLELNKFPATLVSGAFIQSLNVDTTSNTIQFTTELPTSGITF